MHTSIAAPSVATTSGGPAQNETTVTRAEIRRRVKSGDLLSPELVAGYVMSPTSFGPLPTAEEKLTRAGTVGELLLRNGRVATLLELYPTLSRFETEHSSFVFLRTAAYVLAGETLGAETLLKENRCRFSSDSLFAAELMIAAARSNTSALTLLASTHNPSLSRSKWIEKTISFFDGAGRLECLHSLVPVIASSVSSTFLNDVGRCMHVGNPHTVELLARFEQQAKRREDEALALESGFWLEDDHQAAAGILCDLVRGGYPSGDVRARLRDRIGTFATSDHSLCHQILAVIEKDIRPEQRPAEREFLISVMRELGNLGQFWAGARILEDLIARGENNYEALIQSDLEQTPHVAEGLLSAVCGEEARNVVRRSHTRVRKAIGDRAGALGLWPIPNVSSSDKAWLISELKLKPADVAKYFPGTPTSPNTPIIKTPNPPKPAEPKAPQPRRQPTKELVLVPNKSSVPALLSLVREYLDEDRYDAAMSLLHSPLTEIEAGANSTIPRAQCHDILSAFARVSGCTFDRLQAERFDRLMRIAEHVLLFSDAELADLRFTHDRAKERSLVSRTIDSMPRWWAYSRHKLP